LAMSATPIRNFFRPSHTDHPSPWAVLVMYHFPERAVCVIDPQPAGFRSGACVAKNKAGEAREKRVSCACLRYQHDQGRDSGARCPVPVWSAVTTVVLPPPSRRLDFSLPCAWICPSPSPASCRSPTVIAALWCFNISQPNMLAHRLVVWLRTSAV